MYVVMFIIIVHSMDNVDNFVFAEMFTGSMSSFNVIIHIVDIMNVIIVVDSIHTVVASSVIVSMFIVNMLIIVKFFDSIVVADAFRTTTSTFLIIMNIVDVVDTGDIFVIIGMSSVNMLMFIMTKHIVDIMDNTVISVKRGDNYLAGGGGGMNELHVGGGPS